MQAESPITVACIQMEPKIGEKKANVAHSLDSPSCVIPAMSLHRGTRLSRWRSRSLMGRRLRPGWKRPAGTAP
jgi:hypothetical protein